MPRDSSNIGIALPLSDLSASSTNRKVHGRHQHVSSSTFSVTTNIFLHSYKGSDKYQDAMPDPIDELRSPRQAKDHFLKYLKDELFTLNFYRAHMLYFIVVIAISSVVVYGEGVKNGPKEYRDSHLSYMDALFLTCSAMTTTGTSGVKIGMREC